MLPKRPLTLTLVAFLSGMSFWMLFSNIIVGNLLHHKSNEIINEYNSYSNMKIFSDDVIIQRSTNCSTYFDLMYSILPRNQQSKEDLNFPLAFAISVHFQVGILELFLASSFDPQDSYCIHVDAKADEKVTKAVDQMVNCYQWKHPKATIFMVDNPISVFWGHFSVLEADLKCMQLLRTRNAHWNLLINPAGTELPLKPMPEIRKYLEKFPKGIVDSFPLPQSDEIRFAFSYELKELKR